MRSTRVIAVGAAVLLAALVAGATALVATSQSATVAARGPLTVGPGRLTSATGIFSFADTAGLTVTAPFGLNFVTHTAHITATASLSIVTVTAEARLVGGMLYVSDQSLATLTGAPWVTTSMPRGTVALDRIARTLRHPHLAALHANRATVSTTGTTTTTTLWFNRVTLPRTTGLPITLPRTAAVVVTVTTGSLGQVLSAVVRLKGSNDTVVLGLQMTGYNVSVAVRAPDPRQTVVLTPARATQIFGTNAPAVIRLLRGAVAKVSSGH